MPDLKCGDIVEFQVNRSAAYGIVVGFRRPDARIIIDVPAPQSVTGEPTRHVRANLLMRRRTFDELPADAQLSFECPPF